ncbi:hypothetical protein [Asaia krungthepensis]|uniref:FG-GAP repeat protein n=1 Tax=Asaia krungthepensis NRIC 0535 TaxID=1307925 RepID=A0ABQ0Q1M1_9PROT|nr:hypothetical protein [Asaia krungthepensis]GBQ87020.1 hypothetical protein AA0535_1177 [Asaia krungthepensis NRIC 0535]
MVLARMLKTRLGLDVTQSCRLLIVVSFALFSIGSSIASDNLPPALIKFIADTKLTRYGVALTDLNDDGFEEALVYAIASKDGDGSDDFCGSGGCTLYVLSLHGNTYRRVSRITIAKPPIRVLHAKTNGWHDISVRVCGGGIYPCYNADLRFSGHAYPTNPSVVSPVPDDKQAGMTLLTDDVFRTPSTNQ